MNNKLSPFQGPRLVFLSAVMFATFLVLVARLYEWQFVHYSESDAGAKDNATQRIPLPAPRGIIYDRYGTELAINVPAFNITVVPADLPDDDSAALVVLNRLS